MKLAVGCIENKGHENDSTIVCRDKKGTDSQHVLDNDSKASVTKYLVDGCLITSNSVQKCDFLLIISKAKKAEDLIEDEIKEDENFEKEPWKAFEKAKSAKVQKDKEGAIFIELKGTDITNAVRQLNSTIKILNPDIKEYIVFGRIVMSSVPQIQGPDYAKLLEKVKSMGGNLKIKSRKLRETTSSLNL